MKSSSCKMYTNTVNEDDYDDDDDDDDDDYEGEREEDVLRL